MAAAGSGNLTGNTTNWSPATVPGTNDIAEWGNVTFTVAPTANANWTVGELRFAGNQTGGVTFGSGANTITLSANATGSTGIGIQMDNGSGAVSTGSAKFALGAAQSWINNSASNTLTVGGTISTGGFLLTLNGTGATALSGVISGSGGALSISNGTVTLGGNNTFTGGITLNSGTLKLGSSTTGSLGVGGALTINGGTVDVTGARTTPGNNTQTWNADWTYGGSGTWNTGTGAVTLNATSINLTNSGGSLLTVGGTATGTSNLTLKINAGGAITFTDINNTGTITNSGTGTATATLTNVGSNVTAITENSTTSALIVTTLNVAGGGTTLTNALGNKTLTISNTVVGTGNLTIANNSATNSGITFTAGANNTGTIINNGTGAGTTTIPTVGANVTGIFQNASNSSSTLTITNALTGLGGTNTFNISKSNIAITGSAGLTLTGGVNNIGTITNDNTGTGTLTIGAIGTNVTGVTQNSTTSALTLSGTNTFTGGLNINAGTVIGTVAGAMGTSANTVYFGGAGTGVLDLQKTATTYTALLNVANADGTVLVEPATSGAGVTHIIGATTLGGGYQLTVQGGANVASGTAQLTTGAVTLTGNAILNVVNPVAASTTTTLSVAAITGAGYGITVKGNGNLIQAGVFSGASSSLTLDSTFTGAVTLNQANDFTGGVTLNSGTLNINAQGVVGTNGPLGNGGTFTINGGAIDYTSTSSSLSVANVNPITVGGDFAYGGTKNLLLPGAVTLTGNRTITTNGSGTLTLGAIGDGGLNYSLTKAGAGTLIFGSTTITGGIAVSGGLLKMGSSVSWPSTTVVTLSGSGSFDIASNSPTIAGLQDGATITSGSVFNSTNARTLTLGGSGSYLYSGTIGTGVGTVALIKSGSGTQTLAGNNTYTGATTVSLGTLKAGSTTALSSASAFSMTNATGAVLDLNGFNNTIGSLAGGGTTGGNVTLGSATLTAGGNNGTTSYAGVISGTGGLTKTGTGTMTLSGVNTFTGGVTITDGKLVNSNASGAINSANVVTVGGSGTTPILDLSGNGLTIAGLNDGGFTTGNVTNSGAARTLTLGGNGTYSYGGIITATTSANMGITKSGTGTQTLGGINTYTGNTLVSGGTLQFAKQVSLYNNGAAAAWTSTNIKVDSGATMAFNIGGTGEFTKANIITLLGLSTGANGFKTGSIVGLDTTSGDFLYDSVIANTNNGTNVLGLTKLGANKLTLDQANTYTGNTTISQGTLQLGNGGTTGSLATTSTITDNGTLAFNRSDTITQGTNFSSAIGGTGTLVQNGSGTLKLLQNNTYTGGTTINAGTIQLNGGTALGNSTSTWLTFGGNSTLQFFGAADLLATRTIAINPNVTATIDTNGFNSSQAAVISGNGTLAKTGAGTFALTNSANSYTGGTRINQGALSVATGSNLGTAPGSPVANSIEFTGNSTLQLTGNFSFNANRGITVDSGVTGTMEVTGSNAVTAAQIISGAGTLAKAGTGNLTLSGANTYTGGTRVGEGTLSIATGSNLGSIPGSYVVNHIEFTGNSTLQLTGNFSFNANRGITVDSGVTGTMEVTGSNAVTAAQIITGAGTLAKTGTGTLVLSGNNTYTGPTNVTGGSLLVNGNQTSATGAVTVASGATLGGNGTVGGATTIQSGGILAPGNSPGVETFASGLTLQTGSAFTFELDANTADLANRGTNFDGVNVTGGTLAVESGVNFNAIFNLAGSTVDFTDAFWQTTHSWLVFDNANAPTVGSPIFNLGTVSSDSFGNSLPGSLSFSQTDNDIFLNFSFMPPVPEPATWVAMTALILTGGFIGLRRRDNLKNRVGTTDFTHKHG